MPTEDGPEEPTTPVSPFASAFLVRPCPACGFCHRQAARIAEGSRGLRPFTVFILFRLHRVLYWGQQGDGESYTTA